MILGNEKADTLLIFSSCNLDEMILTREEYYFFSKTFKNLNKNFKETACCIALTLSQEDANKKQFIKEYYHHFLEWIVSKNFNKIILFTELLDRFYNLENNTLYLRTLETLNKRKNIEYQLIKENCLRFKSIDNMVSNNDNREMFFNYIADR